MAKLLRRMRSAVGKGLSEDEEFDTLVKVFEETETKLQVIAGAARHYAEAVRSMTMAQKSLSSAVEGFYAIEAQENPKSASSKLLNAYSESSIAADEDSAKRVHDISIHVTEQTQSALELFKSVHDKLAFRKKKRTDYEHYRSKVKALAEKSPDDPQKLPRNQAKLSEAKKEFDDAHTAAMESLDRLVGNRNQLLDPQLAQLAQAHLLLHEGQSKQVQALSKVLSAGETKKAIDAQVVAMSETFAADHKEKENAAAAAATAANGSSSLSANTSTTTSPGTSEPTSPAGK